jgi:hypothetical protein
VLRELRTGEQALASEYGSTRPAEFQGELVAALSARGWRDVAPTFVVLSLPQEFGLWDKPRYDARLDPFIARLQQGSISPSDADARPQTREELSALLVEAGLTQRRPNGSAPTRSGGSCSRAAGPS